MADHSIFYTWTQLINTEIAGSVDKRQELSLYKKNAKMFFTQIFNNNQ